MGEYDGELRPSADEQLRALHEENRELRRELKELRAITPPARTVAFAMVEAELREVASDYGLQIRSNIYLYPAFGNQADAVGQTLLEAVDALKVRDE